MPVTYDNRAEYQITYEAQGIRHHTKIRSLEMPSTSGAAQFISELLKIDKSQIVVQSIKPHVLPQHLDIAG